MPTIIETIFRLKRGTAARWAELNPILDQGEPGFVYDNNLLKVGDGVTPWNDLPYITGKTDILNFKDSSLFPTAGDPSIIYKADDELCLYQFNINTNSYEKLVDNLNLYASKTYVQELVDNLQIPDDVSTMIALTEQEVLDICK